LEQLIGFVIGVGVAVLMNDVIMRVSFSPRAATRRALSHDFAADRLRSSI
jgi:hypothetical protein